MLFSTKNIEDLKEMEELAPLKNQVEETRLQDNLGKHNFHKNREKVFQPITDTIKITSEN